MALPPQFIKNAKAKKKAGSPALEKREERDHKDLDHDGERGEPVKHVEQVLGVGKRRATKIAGEKPVVQSKRADARGDNKALFGGKQAVPFGKKGK